MMDKDELFEREETCQKAIRTVRRAVVMRIVITSVMLWAMVVSEMEPVAMALICLVLVINLMGSLPLIKEWKRQRQLLKELIAQEES